MNGARELGLLIAIGSSAMLFGALLIAYLIMRAGHAVWPPIGMEAVPPLMPTLATLSLICSSILLWFSKKEHYNLQYFRSGIALGALFLIFQFMTWNQMYKAGLGISANQLISMFYCLSVLHALHTLAGWGFLVFCERKLAKDASNPIHMNWARLANLFWTFIDGAWLAIFIVIVWMK